MDELQIFNNTEFGQVRTAEINGKPYFVASDIAAALGYSNPRDAVSRHCKGVVKHDTPTKSGKQSINFIPEGDIYRLIVRSNLPAADRFERWVFDEVLPTIRETGGYHLPRTYSEALRELADKAEKVEKLEAENKKMLPKADFYDAVTSSPDTMSISEVAKVLNLGLGQNKLFRFMRDRRILMKNNLPYQEYIQRGYFRVIEQKYDRPDGEVGISCKTLVTQKGVEFIRRKYEETI